MAKIRISDKANIKKIMNEVHDSAIRSYYNSIDKNCIKSLSDINELFRAYKNGDASKLAELFVAMKYITYYKVVNLGLPEIAKADAYTVLNSTYIYLTQRVIDKSFNDNAIDVNDYFDEEYYVSLANLFQRGNQGHAEATQQYSKVMKQSAQ